MRTKKIIKLIFGLFTLMLGFWLTWTLTTNPSSRKNEIEKQNLLETEVSSRENYHQLVGLDEEQGNNFLSGRAQYATVVNEYFPYFVKRLDKAQTDLIVEVLNDSSSYRWGEFGTPTYDQTIFYYDSTDKIIGYTSIDEMGEIENYPYRSLMKWGMMTDKGYGRLIKAMNSK